MIQIYKDETKKVWIFFYFHSSYGNALLMIDETKKNWMAYVNVYTLIRVKYFIFYSSKIIIDDFVSMKYFRWAKELSTFLENVNARRVQERSTKNWHFTKCQWLFYIYINWYILHVSVYTYWYKPFNFFLFHQSSLKH